VWEWGQFNIFFRDVIVTFLWNLSLLKSVNLWILLNVPESANISEEARAINMLITEEGAINLLICLKINMKIVPGTPLSILQSVLQF